MRNIQWKKSEAIEKILNEFGLKWTVEALNLSTQIDDTLSSNNHARRHRLDDTLVTDYLASMEQGDDFPCGVAVKQPSGSKYLVLGGNHTRKAAEEYDQKMMGFYIVETQDPMILDLLPKVLNRKHGLRKGKEEAIQDAINAMALYKLTPNEAADRFGVHVHTLHVNNRVTLALRRFKALGIKPEKLQLTRGAIVKLNTIPIDRVVEEAVRVAEQQKLNGPEVHAMVDAVYEERSSEKSQLKVVEEFEYGLKSGAKVPHSKGTEQERLYARFMRACQTLDIMLRNKKTIRQMGCNSEPEKQRAIGVLKGLSQKLHALANEE
jgi:hypothetical protein